MHPPVSALLPSEMTYPPLHVAACGEVCGCLSALALASDPPPVNTKPALCGFLRGYAVSVGPQTFLDAVACAVTTSANQPEIGDVVHQVGA